MRVYILTTIAAFAGVVIFMGGLGLVALVRKLALGCESRGVDGIETRARVA